MASRLARAVALTSLIVVPARAAIDLVPGWESGGNHDEAMLGLACWTAGDVNGDGSDEILVAESGDRIPSSGHSYGRVHLYCGSSAPPAPPTTPCWTIEGERFGSGLGTCVRGIGDVNGDGFDDVAVAAWGWSNPETREGRALVFHGAPSGLAPDPDWTFEPDVEVAYIHQALPAGDVNGDGFADLLVTGAGTTGAPGVPGRALVFLGSPTGLGTTPIWSVVEPGLAAESAGGKDVDGDGFDDLVVSSDRRYLRLYRGTPGGPEATPSTILTFASDSYEFADVELVGDVDGDGYGELVVGQISHVWDGDDFGRFSLFRGTASGLEAAPTFSQSSRDRVPPRYPIDDSQDSLGDYVAPIPDEDGDGRTEFLVGAPSWGWSVSGQATLFAWPARWPGPIETWWAIGSQRGTPLGDGFCCPREFGVVAPAGDFNGDGFQDVLVGAPYENAGWFDYAGNAYVFFGLTRPPPPSSFPWVAPLRVRRGGESLRLTWEEGPRFPTFTIHAGTLRALRARRPDHAAIACGLLTATLDVPVAEDDTYYLVSARSHRGVESTLGQDSFGNELPASSPPCP